MDHGINNGGKWNAVRVTLMSACECVTCRCQMLIIVIIIIIIIIIMTISNNNNNNNFALPSIILSRCPFPSKKIYVLSS